MEMSEPISVCVLVNDNQFESQFCLRNLIAKTNYAFKLYVYALSNYQEVNHFLKEISFNNFYKELNLINSFDFDRTVGFCYNDFLKNCKTEYAVFLPSNCIVNDNWLTELKYNYKNFEKSGCTSIKSNSENLKLTSKIFNNETSEDQLRTVYVDDKNFFSDFAFFSTDKIAEIGYVAENLKGLELAEWTFRFFAKGYSNYFLKYENVIRLKTEDNLLKPKITKQISDSFKKLVNSHLKIEAYGE
jgi:hypothetical protein